MTQREKPLKLAICSWAVGVGGGVSRMESYYQKLYDRKKFEVDLFSLLRRDKDQPSFDSSLDFIQIDQKNRYQDLVNRFKSYDVVQFQGSIDPLVCEAAKVAKVPLLIEVLHNIEQGGLFSNIDGTICVSEAVFKLQNKQKNNVVILNGIDLDKFPLKKSQDNLDENRAISILQVARRSKVEVNLDEIAKDLLSFYPNTKFFICGGEQEFPSTESVNFLGIQEDIKSLYDKSDIFIILSKEEPFGLVALEAMSSGIPVVGTNRGGLKEIIVDNVNGFLVDDPVRENSISIIKKIIENIDSVSLKKIKENGRKTVEEKFDIRKTVKYYEDYILKLYDEKFSNTNPKRDDFFESFNLTPPNALVGEALYDFHDQNFNSVSDRLTELSLSVYPITEINCLKIANDLANYIKLKHKDIYNKAIFPYLYFSGDRTPNTLRECRDSLDIISSRGLLDQFKVDWDQLLKDRSS